MLTLTRKGYELLKVRGELERYPATTWERLDKRLRVSPLTIAHEVEVMEFRAAFVAAVRRRPSLTIVEFCTWPAMIAFDACQPDGHIVTVRPDGFIRLRETTTHGHRYDYYFFLEVDRSSESQQVLVNRAHCYGDFYRRGGLANRFGRPAAEFKAFPFRVLVTCRSAERLNNFAERLITSLLPSRSQFWMATLVGALADPLGAVWINVNDYARAVMDTRFATPHDTTNSDGNSYRRDTAREQLVEKIASKRPLISTGSTD